MTTEGPDAGLLERRIREASLSVPPGAPAALALHAREMLRWNRSIRLTAITDPGEVAVKHVLDSLLLLRMGPFSGRILDAGSGGGYPGIPLAVCLPDCEVLLAEASGKKCAFLSRVRGLLSLRNVRVLHGRVERQGGLPLPPCDTVVSRATFPPAGAFPVLSPHLAPGGRLLLMTGPGNPGTDEEEGPVAAAAASEGLVPGRTARIELPEGMGARLLREWVRPA